MEGGVWDGLNLGHHAIFVETLASQDVDFACFVNAEHIACASLP